MKTYQTLLDAIVYAELAGDTFKKVSYSQDDVIVVNSRNIPTMANRITDELEIIAPELKGSDGVSITDVYIDERNIFIVSDDGNTTSFSDIVPEDAISIGDFTINDSNLLQITSDGNSVDVGTIVPDEAVGLSNLEVLPTGFIRITYSDGSTEEVGKIDDFGGVPITDSDIINDHLYITLGDSNAIDLGNVKGEIGDPGSLFTSVEQVRTGENSFYFDFELDNGDTFRVGPALVDRRIASPEDTLRKDFDDETGELKLYPPGVPMINLGVIHGVDGVDAIDGVYVSGITMNDEGNEISGTLSDGSDITFNVAPKQIIIPAGETEIISYNITSNRELVFQLGIPDSDPITINVGKVRGANGLTIDSVELKSNGDIEVTENDDGVISKIIIGNMVYEKIESAVVLATGELQFTTNKGNTIISEGSPNGDNGAAGAFIETVNYDTDDEGMVSIVLTDGTVIPDIGKARPLQTHTVVRDSNDDIIFTFDDGSSVNLGTFDGVDAINVVDISSDSSGVMTLTFDDDSSIQSTGSIHDPLLDVEYENNNNRLVFDFDGRTKNINYFIPENGEHGVWLTELRVLSNGRLRSYFSDGTSRILPGGSVHSLWPTELDLKSPTNNVNDVEILWAWSDGRKVDYGTINHFYADNGSVVTNANYADSGDLVLEWNDKDDTVISGVQPVWIEEIYLEGDTFFAKYNHIDEPQEINTIEDFNGRDGLWVTNMKVNALTRDFNVTYSDGSVVTMGTIDGLEGNWYTSIERDENKNLITTNRFGNAVNQGDFSSLDGILPKWVTNAEITSNRDLELTFNDGDSELLTNIDGIDGNILNNIIIDENRDIVLTYIDSSTTNLGTSDGVDGKILTNLYKNAQGELIGSFYELNDENYGIIDGSSFTTEIVDISLVDGKLVTRVTDGSTTETDVIVRRLTDSSINDDVLSLETNYTTEPLSVGYIAGMDVDDGRYITNMRVVDLELLVTYSDDVNTEVKLSDFNRVEFSTAELIDGVDEENENLKITLTDNTELDLGRVKGLGESVNIVDALINQDGQLVLTYSNDNIYRSESRVMGEHGADIISSIIDENGYLIFNKSDSTAIQAGFVLQDLGFAPFDFTRTYDRGESATYDGYIYVALEDGVESTPSPDNSQWARVRLQGDGNSPDASRPEIISPKDGEVHEYQQPYLLAGDLRNYYSVDTRKIRIFQVDLAENSFTNPLYEAEENLNGHQVNMTFELGTEYKWRCRDIVLETGYITDWSLEGSFTVTENNIQRPVTMFGGGENGTNMPAMSTFLSSTFNGVGTHTETTWQIKRNSDDQLMYDIKNSDLLSTLIPFGILDESTEYSVRCKHHSDNNSSPFSEWVVFTTEVKFTISLTPIVSFIGDDVNATTAKPYFKSNSFLDDLYENYMNGVDLVATWEVRDSQNGMVWTITNPYDILTAQVTEVMNSGETYTIRVKYSSPRFFGESEWSNSVSFTPDWSINTPSLTTPYDVIDYPVDGLFEGSVFEGVNEEHIGSVWEIRKASNGEVVHSSYNSFENKMEWTVSFGENDSQEEYNVVLKHLGRYGESEWSEPLLITMQEIIDISIYVSDNNGNVYRFTNDGTLLWVNSDHTSKVQNIAVDDLKNVYTAGYTDQTVRKFDEFGREVWVYNHEYRIYSVAVDNDDYSVYFGNNNGEIIKLDSDLNEIWRFTDAESSRSLAIDTEQNLYCGGFDNSVRKIDKDGNQIWSFTGHSNNVYGVSVDVDGNVYSGSLDSTVRKISPRGAQIWSFSTGGNSANTVSVNTNFQVFSGTSKDIFRIDPDGNETWKLSISNNINGIDSDYLNRSYAGTSDGRLIMLSDDGVELWSYDIGNVIYSVKVTQAPVLFKPVELSGRFYTLKPPTNLTGI